MADQRALQNELKQVDDLLRRGLLADAERRMLTMRARLPMDPLVAYQLGRVWNAQNRIEEAARIWQQALAAKPGWVQPVVALANAAKILGRHSECLRYCGLALQLVPNEPQVLFICATSLLDLKRLPEALAAVDRSLGINPGFVPGRVLRLWILDALRRFDDAEAEGERILAIVPDETNALAMLTKLRRQRLAFAEEADPGQRLLAAATAGKQVLDLIEMARLTDDPALLALAANVGSVGHVAPLSIPTARALQDRPLTIAYMSGDLRNHPVAHMLMDVLAAHDRKRVRVITVGTVPDESGAEAVRLRQLVDEHLNISDCDDATAITRLRKAGVDVLIDLIGCTRNSRPNVLLGRAAPVQVMWLGCPVTTGTRRYDAWLVDDYVAPPGYDQHTSEPLVRLSCSYHPIGCGSAFQADQALTRTDLGLPEGGPLLAAIHLPVKLNAEMVDAWLRIIASHPSAMLWVAIANPAAQETLRSRARAIGLDPTRLIFANYEADRSRYLARWRLADFALDSFPYGGHSTVGEALAGGCPVLTRCGRSIPSRVAGSMLHQLGLDELIANDLPAYEAIARGLLADPARLAALRERSAAAGKHIAAERDRSLARALEDAYMALHSRALEAR